MEIQEDSSDEGKKDTKENSNLSLRKPKTNPKNITIDDNNIYNNDKNFNELLPGEIQLNNEEIVFTNKKRQREHNLSIINLSNDSQSNLIFDQKLANDEEQLLSQKALDIYKELNIPPTPGIKEGDYDVKYHDKREAISTNILKDEDMILNQRKLACTTQNIDIYCAILDNFNTFAYYNNKFMVNSHDYLDKIVENAFNFKDKTKSIPLVLKFANSVFDFGFFEEHHQRYVEFFINIFLNENKMKDINSIPRAKIYLYYIIYLIFKDSWENIKIEKKIFRKFVAKILLDLNISEHELTEIIVQLVNAICDNILYPKIFKNEAIDIEVGSEINRYMFKLISETINSLPQNEKDKIIKVDSLNFIIKQSFNVIIKIIGGINLINENNISLQETLVSKDNKKLFYEFILLFSNLNLNNKNFCWFLDIMAKFAEISYYSDVFLDAKIINVIFEKFIVKKNFICEVFQFMRSLLEVGPLFKYYCTCEKFYIALNSLDVEKNPFLTSVHYMFIIKELLEKGEANKCLDNIYERLCTIQAKEKVEQIFYKFGNEDIIQKKYHEVMPKLDELNKKIQED